jgi:hypothetical protein
VTDNTTAGDYQLIALACVDHPDETGIWCTTLMCFLPGVPRSLALDAAQQYAHDRGLAVLSPELVPPGVLTHDDREAIHRAYAEDPELTCVVHWPDHCGAITRVYCDQCDRTIYYAVHGNDELLEAAGGGDDNAAAKLAQARADLLVTHQMDCQAA